MSQNFINLSPGSDKTMVMDHGLDNSAFISSAAEKPSIALFGTNGPADLDHSIAFRKTKRMKPILCWAVLFDMDGVLVDSTAAVARVWAGWARERGFEPHEVVRKAHGRPSIQTIRELLPNGDHAAEDREVERREIEDIADVVALPGTVELLSKLPEERWAVVTSATRPLAEVRLRAAGLPVMKHLITASELRHGKPHPEPYLKGAAMLRVTPRECLVVEDAPSGVRSGKAAGARVLALRTTMPGEELVRAGADWLADNLATISLDGVERQDGLSFFLEEKK